MLLDKKLNKHLLDDGFVILKNSISKTVLADLKQYYLSTFKSSNLQKYIDKNITHVNTAMSENIDYKRDVYQFLLKNLTPFIETNFSDYKISVGNYIVKYPGGDNECEVHQDISLVRESLKTSSLTIWFTLDDLDEKTAPLYVVPETHKTLLNFIRGIDFTLKLNNYKEELLKRSKILLPLNAGDVITMYPRVVHGSVSTPANHNMRIAIGLGIIPKSEKLFIYQQTQNGLEELEMTQELLLNYIPNKKEDIKCSKSVVAKERYENYHKFITKLEKNLY